jgi:succinate dehydrogenase / fumarate reductase membrane anchor subunit
MTATTSTERTVKVRPNYESTAWKWMRYSALLLIPLVWIHAILQDVVVGVHNMDIGYVAERWASIGWRVFDAFLLGFAFAHGMNGVRQVLADFIHSRRVEIIMNWVLFILWLAIFVFGFIALIAGVGQQVPVL